ncbi:MAG TPA: hypothetical protein DD990_15310 [Cyanobacteria bacterium UBA11368]|nr:hypothetical protein [Cyanobacteria bacterium UBA11368]
MRDRLIMNTIEIRLRDIFERAMAEKKDAMLHIRISSSDLEKIRQRAESLGLTQTEFCLNAILAAIGEDLEKPVMDSVLTRLAALERVVFQQSAA